MDQGPFTVPHQPHEPAEALSPTTSPALRKEVSARLTNAIIRFTRARQLDPQFLWEGLGVGETILADVHAWVAAEVFNTMMARLRERTGEPAIMEQVGLSTPEFQSLGFIHIAAFMLEDPTQVINQLVSGMLEALTKTSVMEVLTVTPRETLMTHHIKPPFPVPKDTCYFVRGCFEALPKTWGLPVAHVAEEACQADGAPACRYRISWPHLSLWHRLGIWFNGRRLRAELFKLLNEQNTLIEVKYEEALRKSEALEQAYFRILESLMEALDTKDHSTRHHSKLVAAYTVEIAKTYGLPEPEVEQIRQAALLHDIGKIGVPDHILVKPGPLSAEERVHMHQHPVLGEKILQPLSFLGPIIDMVAQEHERFDGRGYPRGLRGTQIHLGARIISVADALDAMTSTRSYRKALAFEDAVAEIERCAGTQFDPQIVVAFRRVLPQLKAIHQRYHSEDTTSLLPQS